MRFRVEGQPNNSARASVVGGSEVFVGQAGNDNSTFLNFSGVLFIQNNRTSCNADYVAPAQINSVFPTSRYIDPFVVTLRPLAGWNSFLRVEKN